MSPVKPIRDTDVETLVKQIVPGVIKRNNPVEMLQLIATLNNALLTKSDENAENLKLLKSCQKKLDEANKKIDELEKK